MGLFTLLATWIIFFGVYKWFTRPKSNVALAAINKSTRLLICSNCYQTSSATNGTSICSHCHTRL
ncbi:MAG: hypothetical protein ACI35O_06055 [Bacillaceae bacterium]